MIARFQTTDSLRKYLQKDSAQSSRFAGRFIMLNSSDDWRVLLPILIDGFARPLYLSHFCAGDDSLPRLERLLEELRATQGNMVIVGLSEILRLYPSQRVEEFVTNLLLLENASVSNMQKRIYVPLLGVKDALMKVANSLSRWEEFGESASVVELCSDKTGSVRLEIADSGLSVPASGTICNGVKRWLELVEGAIIPSEVRLNTRTVAFVRPCSDSAIRVVVIKSHYQKLRTILNDGELPPEEFGEPASWALLLRVASKTGERTLQACVQAVIPGLTFNVTAWFEQWPKLDSDQRWLLWLLLQQRSRLGQLSGYSNKVIKRCSHQDKLTTAVSCAIFDYTVADLKGISVHLERRLIMGKVGLSSQPQEFWDELCTFALEEQLFYLSFFTEDEKCHAIKLIAAQQMSLEDIHARREIAELYPALHAYVAPLNSDDSWLEEYFYMIRLAKLRNEYPSEIVDLISKWPDRIYSHDARNDVLGKAASQEGVQVHYYDCLGAEWVPFLCCEISRLASELEFSSKIVRVNLPTTTEANQPEEASYLRFDDKRFDGLVHTHVEYPKYFVRQLDIVQQYSQDIVMQAIQGSALVVTADHGSSRLAILNHHNTIALPEGSKAKYLGRYAISSKPKPGPCWITSESGLLITNHSRFSSSGPYGCENHGGATPEEVLVPFICIRRRSLRLVNIPGAIRYRPGRPVLWTIELDHKVNSASASCSTGVYRGKLENGGRTIVFDLAGIRPGRYKMALNLLSERGEAVKQVVELRVAGGLDTVDQFWT